MRGVLFAVEMSRCVCADILRGNVNNCIAAVKPAAINSPQDC